MRLTTKQLKQVIKEELEIQEVNVLSDKEAKFAKSLEQKVLDIVNNEVIPLALSGKLVGAFDSIFFQKLMYNIKAAKSKGGRVNAAPRRNAKQIQADNEKYAKQMNADMLKKEKARLRGLGWTEDEIKQYFSPEEVRKRKEEKRRSDNEWAAEMERTREKNKGRNPEDWTWVK